MMNSLLNTTYFATIFLALFASAEWFYHKWKIKAEVTRKYVHVITGFLTLLFPYYLNNHWLVLLLCTSFLILLTGSLKYDLLPSINAVDRVTRGSILYPIVVYSCYLIFQRYDQFMFYYLPILILAISDPVAALVGKKWPIGPYQTFGYTKTWSGSLGFYFSTLFISFLFLILAGKTTILVSILLANAIACCSTLAEALSHKGYDNLTIPAAVLVVLISFKELNFIV